MRHKRCHSCSQEMTTAFSVGSRETLRQEKEQDPLEKYYSEPGAIAHAYSLSSWEAEAGGSLQRRNQLYLHSKLHLNQGCPVRQPPGTPSLGERW